MSAEVDAERVAEWIAADPDPATRAELAAASDVELAERFAAELRFGTAGLRGPVRAGPNGMNVAVVTRATAGLAAWLRAHGHGGGTVVVGRDARHGSEKFAIAAAEVLTAAGFHVIAMGSAGPTPLVAFACRDLDAVAGVQITASHNPPRDNGYKVYLAGGAQIVPPADGEIEEFIAASGRAADIARAPVEHDPRADEILPRYLDRLRIRFGRVADTTLRIALTPMHGVGGALALDALAQAGFTDVHVVDEQFAPDPEFPTVAFPNPEEPGASDLLLARASAVGADIAIALDPDADRCAVGTRVDGTWRMLTGDDTGALLGSFVLAEIGGAPGTPVTVAASATSDARPPVVASTLVSGSLLEKIARDRGARHVTTLTGFKWLVRAGEPLRYAYEEAIGHCVDPDAVRDKDGISAAVALAVLAERCHRDNIGLDDVLLLLYERYGVHVTRQHSVRVDDLGRIATLMHRLRTSPPTTLAGIAVTAEDYARRADRLSTDAVALRGVDDLGMSVRVMARPSGTEPKLKYYIEMTTPPDFGSSATHSSPMTTYRADTRELVGMLDDLTMRVVTELATFGETVAPQAD